MKTIELTQGKIATVDDCDYEYLMQWKWCYSGVYAVRRKSKHTGHLINMHRNIFEQRGVKVNGCIDHIDRNKLNNQFKNLRLATVNQNQYNCVAQVNNSSGFKGVSRIRKSSKWLAQIRANGKSINLGTYPTREDAARAWNKAALKLHSEFAYQNVIQEPQLIG